MQYVKTHVAGGLEMPVDPFENQSEKQYSQQKLLWLQIVDMLIDVKEKGPSFM